MTGADDRLSSGVTKYIDENLKQVFSQLEQDEIPDEITDLLAVLRAQDEELKGDK